MLKYLHAQAAVAGMHLQASGSCQAKVVPGMELSSRQASMTGLVQDACLSLNSTLLDEVALALPCVWPDEPQPLPR